MQTIGSQGWDQGCGNSGIKVVGSDTALPERAGNGELRTECRASLRLGRWEAHPLPSAPLSVINRIDPS